MSDEVLAKGAPPRRNIPRLAAFGPLVLFLGLVVVLAIGLTLNPREIPSPLIGKPVPETFVIDRNGRIAHKVIGPLTPQILQDKVVPLIRDLRK